MAKTILLDEYLLDKAQSIWGDKDVLDVVSFLSRIDLTNMHHMFQLCL